MNPTGLHALNDVGPTPFLPAIVAWQMPHCALKNLLAGGGVGGERLGGKSGEQQAGDQGALQV